MFRLKIIVVLFVLALFTNISISQTIDATPKSGKSELTETIKRNFDYPEKALINNIQGTVTISFKTDTKGKVISYRVTDCIDKELDSAAVSLFRKIIWNPAEKLGVPIVAESEFDVNYNKKKFLKLAKRRKYKHIAPPLYPIDTSYKIYTLKVLDTLPVSILPDGSTNMYKYIYSELNYPEAASKLSLTGEVVIGFIIEANGIISNIIPVESLGGGCTEEAIRVIKTINWIPSVHNGKSVRTNYQIKIHFKKAANKDNYIPNQQGSGI